MRLVHKLCLQRSLVTRTPCSHTRKDFLIGGAQFLICSIRHVEWAWHRLKTWRGGGTCPWFLHLCTGSNAAKDLEIPTIHLTDSRGDSRLLHLYTTTAMAATAKVAIRPKMTKPGIETGLAGSWWPGRPVPNDSKAVDKVELFYYCKLICASVYSNFNIIYTQLYI